MSYEQLLEKLAGENPDLIVMTAENRAAIRGLPPKLGPRFIDVGIAEQTMIGAAAGLALRGRVVLTHALSTFLVMRAFEFIRTDVGIAHLPVKLIGCVPGFLSEANGPTHQAIEDVALMRSIPHMEIWCPADEQELLAGLPELIARPAPCYVRYNASKPAVDHAGSLRFGEAEVFGDGEDVALVTYGFLVEQAERARQLLSQAGLGVRLINMRTLAPVDEDALIAAAEQTKLLVTIEDHFQRGGLYTILAELLLQRGLTGRVMPIALDQRWFKPTLMSRLLDHEGFSGERIAERVQRELAA